MKWLRLPLVSTPRPAWLRAAWVVMQVVAAIWMARSGLDFYYQGF